MEQKSTYESSTEPEQKAFDRICEQHGAAGEFEISMCREGNRARNPDYSFRAVTVRHRKSSEWEIFYADNPQSSPRHWLKRFDKSLPDRTFGDLPPETQEKADRRYG